MLSIIKRPADLACTGPLIDVKLWVPESTEQEEPAIPPVAVVAEINTGASRTIIQEGVATSLGLEPAGTVQIATITTMVHESYEYRIRLVFSPGCAIEVTVIEAPYVLNPNRRVKCLIGRDILRRGVLHYNGLTNMFSLIF